jgi:glycosyltransferase involved in cell wall biosynthesis
MGDSLMKVLSVHNHYQQFGGEDKVFASETALLESHGHQVVRFTVSNDQASDLGPLDLAKATIWNEDIYQELRALIRKEQPHIAHFYNTFLLVSPAAYHAVKEEGVPVVQALQNYRLLCPNKGLLFRENKVCEECIGKFVPWPGVVHGCYRGSRPQTAVVAAMLSFHRTIRTYQDKIDLFIPTIEFVKEKHVEGGFPPEKMMVKPNFLDPDPGLGSGEGDFVLFVGRLTEEKGVLTLLKAWESLGQRVPLKILGDGPLSEYTQKAASQNSGVEYLGFKSAQEIYELMGQARALVCPSEWYEPFGLVIIEAYAKGTPVIAANQGSMKTLIDHQRTGLHFDPGQADQLVEQVEWMLAHPSEWQQMRRAVRSEFEQKYTAEQNYQRLIHIYQKAIG